MSCITPTERKKNNKKGVFLEIRKAPEEKNGKKKKQIKTVSGKPKNNHLVKSAERIKALKSGHIKILKNKNKPLKTQI